MFGLLNTLIGLPTGDNYRIDSVDDLCSECKQMLLSKTSAESTMSEEELWRNTVYSGLACFASGALLGMVLGIIQD